jgi:hypothetical protein
MTTLELILKLFGGLALIVLSAVIIMALLLRFLNKYPVDRDEDRDESEFRADQIIAASEPAPLDDVFRKNGAI